MTSTQDTSLHLSLHFNSHAHVERDGTHQKTIITEEDFNSHAHVERDDTLVVMLSISRISTHTLTWSVTRLSATLQKMYQYFNSHAHVERDCIVYPVNSNFYDFNSHAHVERDCETPPTPMPPHSFQLTRSRGAWLHQKAQRRDYKNFNSHAHVERDLY